MAIQTWVLKRRFLKNEVSPTLQGKQWTAFVVNNIQTSKLQSGF